MKNRINTGKLGAGIRVRILRPWRGYPVGAIIDPPGGLRQILLQAKDQLGRQVASIEPEPKPQSSSEKPKKATTAAVTASAEIADAKDEEA